MAEATLIVGTSGPPTNPCLVLMALAAPPADAAPVVDLLDPATWDELPVSDANAVVEALSTVVAAPLPDGPYTVRSVANPVFATFRVHEISSAVCDFRTLMVGVPGELLLPLQVVVNVPAVLGALAALEEFRLDRDTAVAYAYLWILTQRLAGTSLTLAPVTAGEAALRMGPAGEAGTTDGWIVVASVLQGNWRIQLTLDLSQDGTIAARRRLTGAVEPIKEASPEFTPLWPADGAVPRTLKGEEERRRVTAHQILRAASLEPILGPWCEITEEVDTALRAEVSLVCGVRLPPHRTVIRTVALPFYPLHDLYVIDTLIPGTEPPEARHRRAYVLWGTHGVVLLDRTSGPIYSLSDQMDVLGMLALTEESVPSYLRFFFGLVQGRKGRRPYLIEEETVQVRDSDEAAISHHPVGPIVARRDADDEFRGTLTVRLTEMLWSTGVHISVAGVVTLVDETLIGEVISPPEVIPPPDDLRLTRLPEHPELLWPALLKQGMRHPRADEAWKPLVIVARDQLVQKAAGWEQIDAAEFLTRARTGDVLQRLRVEGDLRITDQDLPPGGRLIVRDVQFGGSVTLEAPDGGRALDVRRCLLPNSWRVHGSWNGDLRFKTIFQPPVKTLTMDRTNFQFDDATIRGSIALDGIFWCASISADRATCRDVFIDRCGTMRINLDRASLSGEVYVARTFAEVLCSRKGRLQDVTVDDVSRVSNVNFDAVDVAGWMKVLGKTTRLVGRRMTVRHGCRVAQCESVDLDETLISGSLQVKGVANLWMCYTRVTESVTATCHAAGRIMATGLHARQLSIGPTDGMPTLEWLDCSGADLDEISIRGLRTQTVMLLDGVRVKRSLIVRGCRIGGDLGMDEVRVGVNVVLLDTEVGGSWKIGGAEVGGAITARSWFDEPAGTHVVGHVLLHGARAAKLVLRAFSVGRDVRARNAQFGEIQISPGLVQEETGRFAFRPSSIGGRLHLVGITVMGDVDLTSLRIRGDTPKGAQPAVSARRIRVDGDLRFCIDGLEKRQEIVDEFVGFRGADPDGKAEAAHAATKDVPWRPRMTWICGGMTLRALKVGGEMDLSSTGVSGRLRLEQGQVEGRLILDRTFVGENLRIIQFGVGHDLTMEAVRLRGSAALPAIDVGGELLIHRTRIGGDLDLTDATLHRGLRAASAPVALNLRGTLRLDSVHSSGSVDLRGVVLGGAPPADVSGVELAVDGTLRLADADRACSIPGSLHLVRAKLRHLALSDDPFPTGRCTLDPAPRDAIDLSDAQVGTLSVLNPPPSPLRLRGLTVHLWDFQANPRRSTLEGVGATRRGNDEAPQLIAFLAQAPDVDRPLYRAIEQRLYDEGNEAGSDAVYQAMQRRGLAWRRSPLRWLLSEATGHFTVIPALTWAVFALWLGFSVALFRDPSTVEAPDRRAEHPADAGWGWGDAFWISLQYHVPVVSLGGGAAWVAADTEVVLRAASGTRPQPKAGETLSILCPHISEAVSCVLPVTARSYAAIVALLHWLIVPTLIILLSRRVLRRARQTR